MSQELQIGHFEQMQMKHQFLFDLILYIPSQSTIFHLCQDGSSWVSLNIFHSINTNDIQHMYIVNIQRIRMKA